MASKTNSTYIECTINTENSFPVDANFHLVSLNVLNRGAALNSIMNQRGRSYLMVPAIYKIYPRVGSEEGGTLLTIRGEGFYQSTPGSWADASVDIGRYPCEIKFMNYTMIKCITPWTAYVGGWITHVKVSKYVVAECQDSNSKPCLFLYSYWRTPKVNSFMPREIVGPHTDITIRGSGFQQKRNTRVTIGGANCAVTYLRSGFITCRVSYVPPGDAEVIVNIAGKGYSRFKNETEKYIWSDMEIESVTPMYGSTGGGQLITITGSTFVPGDTKVDMQNSGLCEIQSINASQITCITPKYGGYGQARILLYGGRYIYNNLRYYYSVTSTPVVSDAEPLSGQFGDQITITGSYFGTDPSENLVTIGGTPCEVITSTLESITCTAGPHAAGLYPIHLFVQGKGQGKSSLKFEYQIGITETSSMNQGM